MKEITIGFENKMPCLHCGEMIDMDNDIHFCNAPHLEWLKKQDEAKINLPNGGIWDIKKKKSDN